MSNLIDYAKQELEEAGLFSDGDFYGGMTGKSVMELIKVFSEQGHSGMSAGIVRQLFNKLSAFEPINEMKFTDDQWNEVGNDLFQHKKLSAIFKEKKDGKPYYIESIIWEYPDGCSVTSGNMGGFSSSQYIRIPFVQKKFYVKIDKEGNALDKDELQKALDYYDGNLKQQKTKEEKNE